MDEPFDELLQKAFPRAVPAESEPAIAGGPTLSGEQDALLGIVEKTQYALYVVFQLFVVALTAATTVALIVAIWRLVARPDTSEAIVAMVIVVGSVVTGAAAMFVQRQANAAKKQWEDARRYRQQNL